MSEPSLDELVRRLQSLPAGTTLSEAMATVAPPESAVVAEARRRVALVRWFDPAVYGFLCADADGAPAFEDFAALPGVTRLAPGRWQLAETLREPLLAAWRESPRQTDWRQWNGRLAGHFLARRDKLGMEAELAAIYHGAAGPDPDALAGPLRAWFEAADREFDLARGNALLEMLKLQARWRGEILSQLYAELRAYGDTRLLFADDYYKTGSYLERPEVLAQFLKVKDREPGTMPWIFHLHASGGTGKTMFIRWLLSRRLVPERTLCARVDFDDFLLHEVLDQPVRLFRRIVDQLSRQPGGDDFTSLAEKLAVAEVSGWHPILDEAHRQLASTQASARRLPVVVVLDTLEEATLSAAEWLQRCIAALREWLYILPGLTLVLSGRYDLASRSQSLQDGEFLGHELPRFSDDEARRYLLSRGLAEGEVLEAIVDRSGAEESGPAADARNPFKLALFAELALNRANLTAADVHAYPRVDIAYLIERVVKRIESQPLRWMLRYGAVARDLDLQFAEAVLLPRLLEALRGEAADRPEEGLDGGPDVWKEDPEAAAHLAAAGGLQALWEQLAAYARDRGWLSSRQEEGELRLRLHPEVVNPVRELLREQPVYAGLQARAAEWFDARATDADGSNEGSAAVAAWREAVFHAFQAEGTAARSYWEDCLKAARRFGPEVALPLALELAGRDYAEAEIEPLPRVSSPELLAAAHAEAAWLYLEADGRDFMAPKHWADFVRHVDRADTAARGDPAVLVNPVLLALRDAWKLQDARLVDEVLADAVFFAGDPRERLFMALQRGRALILQGSPAAAEAFREVLGLLPQVEPDWLPVTVVHLERARCYARQGVHVAVREAFQGARQNAGDDPDLLLRVTLRETEYALDVADRRGAEKGLMELRGMPEPFPAPAELNLLQAREFLALEQPTAALAAAIAVHRHTDAPALRASGLEIAGSALALSFDFRGALENWESATSLYESAGDRVGITRCAVLAIALKAKRIGNLRDAAAQLDSTRPPDDDRDPAGAIELALLRAYLEVRRRRKPDRLAPSGFPDAFPPALRARVLVFVLGFGLVPPDPEFLDELEAALAAIQPLSLRATVLDWLEFADAGVEISEEAARRLLSLFPRPRQASTEGTALAIRRADLWRVLGRRDEAAQELARVAPATIVERWRLELAGQRLGLPTRFAQLAEAAAASDLGNSYLTQVIRWEAEGKRGEHAPPPADPLAGGLSFGPAGPGDPSQPANIWQARYLARLAESGLKAGIPALTDQILPQLAALEDELGQSVPRAEPPRPAGNGQSPEAPKEDEPDASASAAAEPADTAESKSNLDENINEDDGPRKGGESLIATAAKALVRRGLESVWEPLGAVLGGILKSAHRVPIGAVILDRESTADSDSAPAAAAQVPPDKDSGGGTPAPAGAASVLIPEAAASQLNTALEPAFVPVIDQMIRDWRELADDMRSVLLALDAGEGAAIDPRGRLAALPWELAGAGHRVSTEIRKRDWPPAWLGVSSVIRLIGPREEEDEVSYATTTGGRLEDVYARFGGWAEKVYAVPLDRLGEHLHDPESPPTLLHLVASVREGHHDAVYLDFASTARRSAAFGPQQKGGPAPEETTLSVDRLDRLLAGFPRPPFLILDIARPSNPAEAARMLLLRNLYASRLFERGHARGILGCGLAQPYDRLPLAARMIEALLSDSPAAARRVLAAESRDDLDSILPRAGAALWSNLPNQPLFRLLKPH